MQKKPTDSHPHPAETVATAVFKSCCNTLGSMRRIREDSEYSLGGQDPDADYQKEWRELAASNEPFIREYLEHPITSINWDDLILNMNRLSYNERNYKDLAYRQKTELVDAARFHPCEILPLAVRHAREISECFPNRSIDLPPGFAAHPFPIQKVIGWLRDMDLLENHGCGLRARETCFQSKQTSPHTGLGLEAVRKIADWVTGPSGPPARALHFHLVDANGQPAMARDILYLQGLSAPNETHLALLHVLPSWSEERRAILRDLILARWIRSVETYGFEPSFLSACAAIVVRRWQHLCDHLPNIPTAQIRPKGSSAGFNRL